MVPFSSGMLGTLAILTWSILRPILGWFFIIVGVAGILLPILNGTIILIIGTSLVGHRNRIIRWTRVHIKLVLRRWAALRIPVVGHVGRLVWRMQQETSRQYRRMLWWWQARKQARLSAPGA